MDEKKICSCCGKENEPNADYCAECGSVLTGSIPNPENLGGSNVPPPVYSAGEPYVYTNYRVESGEEITADEMFRFVGKNGDKILKKFNKMEYSGSKAGWCWPVFILTFLFGFVGTGFWFLYRKMTKLGAIFLCLGLAIGLVFSVADDSLRIAAESTGEIMSSMGEVKDFSDVMDALENISPEIVEESMRAQVVNSIHNIFDLSIAIIFGILSMSMYKKHCVNTILNIKRRTAENPVMAQALFSDMGGVSGAALGIGIIVYLIGSEAIESLVMLILY